MSTPSMSFELIEPTEESDEEEDDEDVDDERRLRGLEMASSCSGWVEGK